jgi:hypothetical protein
MKEITARDEGKDAVYPSLSPFNKMACDEIVFTRAVLASLAALSGRVWNENQAKKGKIFEFFKTLHPLNEVRAPSK